MRGSNSIAWVLIVFFSDKWNIFIASVNVLLLYDVITLSKNLKFGYPLCNDIKIELKKDYYAEIVPRSSLSKSGYILSNSIGIIDNSYRGNLLISLTKICDDMPDITLPNRCCQLIIKKQLYIDLYEVDEEKNLYNTTRNEGGFGSTW